MTWTDNASNNFNITARIFRRDGVAITSEFTINETLPGEQSTNLNVSPYDRYHRTIASDTNGNFVVTWRSDQDAGQGFNIYARRFDQNGIALGAEFRVNNINVAGDQRFSVVAMAPDGRFAIVWQSEAGTNSSEIFGQMYNADGTANGGEFRLNQTLTGAQVHPSIAMDAKGNLYAVWDSPNIVNGAANDIILRKFDLNGLALTNEFRVNTITNADQIDPSIAIDESGQFIVVAWESDHSGTKDVYTQRLFAPSFSAEKTGFVDVLDVNNANNAPILDNSGIPQLTAIPEDVDDASNPGNTIEDIIGNTITDADGPLQGIAITALDNSNGVWQYSINDGFDWTDINAASDNAALLLKADTHTSMRFVPNLNYNGPATFSYRAWDQSDGNSNGAEGVDTTANGGTTAFSANVDTAQITVIPVNDAPINTVPLLPIETNHNTAVAIPGVSVADVDINETAAPNNTIKVDLLTALAGGTMEVIAFGGVSITGNDTHEISITGNLFDVNETLKNLIYKPATGFTGTQEIFMTSDDLGHTGGDALIDNNDSFFVTVKPVNDEPEISAPEKFQVNEDTNLSLTGISVSDADSKILEVRFEANNGVLAFSPAGNTTITDNGSNVVSLVGSVNDINETLLNPVIYSPPANFNGHTFIEIFAQDDLSVSIIKIKIDVTPVNDAPVVIVPGPQNISEDTNLILPGISVADVDLAETPDGKLKVDLSVEHGILNLTQVGDAVLNNNGSKEVSIIGNAADVNIILDSLIYQGDLNFNGFDLLTVKVDDQGNTGAPGFLTDTKTIEINVNPVNDAPILDNTGDPRLTNIPEDVSNTSNPGNKIEEIIGRTITDADGPLQGIAITALDNNNANGFWQYSTDDGVNWTDIGPVSDNAALLLKADTHTSMRFVPNLNYNGPATFSYRAWDQSDGNPNGAEGVDTSPNNDKRIAATFINNFVSPPNNETSAFSTNVDTAQIDVIPVNDGPVITVPLTQIASEDTDLMLLGISVADVDLAETPDGKLKMNLSVEHGILNLTQVGDAVLSNNGSKSVSINGNATDVNAILDSLIYRGDLNFNGSDLLTVRADDQGNTGSEGPKTDLKTVDINVLSIEDSPEVTAPANAQTNEDTNVSLVGIRVNDADDKNLDVHFNSTNGILTFTPSGAVTIINNGSDFVRIMGSIDDINATLLNPVIFSPTPQFNGLASVEVFAFAENNEGSGHAQIPIDVTPVNDAPVITVPGAQNGNEDANLSLPGISVVDTDLAETPSGNLKVDLSASHGTLTLILSGNATLNNNGSKAVSIIGSAVDVNATLDSLIYKGDPNFNGSDAIIAKVDDQGNTGSGGVKTDTKTIDINVDAANDAPVVIVPGPQNVNEDTDLSLPGISVADADLAEAPNGNLRVDLSVSHGTVNLIQVGDATISNNGSKIVTIIGNATDINAILASLVYRGDPNFNGFDLLTVKVDDQGNVGSGGALSDVKTIAITVNPEILPLAITPQQIIEDVLPIPLMPIDNIDLVQSVFKNKTVNPSIPYLTDENFDAYETPEFALYSPPILTDSLKTKNSFEYAELGQFYGFPNSRLTEILNDVQDYRDNGDLNTRNLLDEFDQDNEQPTDVMDKIKSMHQSFEQQVLKVLNDTFMNS
ncbi:MAG: Ig-like domain-containing protein [Alphaproteobacteria bacterium]|nr:Ig-like domain-containing protein [Alphaproteobacteria bacterium]